MPDILTFKKQFKFELSMQNSDGETETRSLSFDTTGSSAALAAAKEFRDLLVGGGSTSLSIIDAKKFIQPASWEDNDPNYPPYTATRCQLSLADTTTTYYEGGGVVSGRDIDISYNATIGGTGRITFLSDIDVAPTVYYRLPTDNNQITADVVNRVSFENGVATYEYILPGSGETIPGGTVISVLIPATPDYEAAAATYTIIDAG